MIKLKWLVYGVLALFLAWRVVVVNISQYLAAEDNQAATQWKWDTPHALLLKAESIMRTDPIQARKLVLDSSLYNPANGRAFLMLAILWEREGKMTLAKNAADMANFLAPHDADVQLKLGTFWALRGQPIQTLSHWGAAIETRPTLGTALFPVMLEIVDTPQMRLSFAQALKDAPAWWGKFFMYAIKNATHEETLKAIYNVRINMVGHEERRAYLDHLISVGLYTDAYFVWLNGLQASQISALGNVYDGGFEHAIDDEGFGWRPVVANGFRLTAEPTYGNAGQKALHVAFQDTVLSQKIIYQFLMLDPGQYHFRGRVRPDNLSAGNGLQWVATCADLDGKELLATSEHFLGSDEWNKFETVLNVPTSKCEIQMIRLQIDIGPGGNQLAPTGAVWFDDLEMVKIN